MCPVIACSRVRDGSTGNALRCRLASWDTHIDPDGS